MAERVAFTGRAGNGHGLARDGAVRIVEVGTVTGQVTYVRDDGVEVTEPTGDVEGIKVQAARRVAGLVTVRVALPGGQTATRRHLAGRGEPLDVTHTFPSPVPVDPSVGQVIRYGVAWMSPQRVVAELVEADDPPISPRQAIRAMFSGVEDFDRLVRQYRTSGAQRRLRRRYRRHRARVAAELAEG